MKSRFSQFGASSAVAVGAGLASALLFSLVSQATIVAIALAYLSPLPIMIAMIGFGRAAGVTATFVATLAVFAVAFVQQAGEAEGAALAAAGIAGLTFALSLAAPALWLSYLAATSRPKDGPTWSGAPAAGRSGAQDRSTLERLLAYGVAVSATIAVIATVVVSARQGGFEAALNHAAGALTPMLKILAAEAPLPSGVDLLKLARLIVLAAPPAVAASTLLMLLLNLWLAARVAQVSGRLSRPWPDIPHELRLSRIYAPVFLAAVGVAFVGGLAGTISAIVAAALGMAFALQGLAVIHDVSRGSKYRVFILGLVYIALIILAPPWLLIAFAALGLVESIFSLRDRKKNSISPKS
ncbi:conserved membrane hypothetical protein [Methylocella tundrae]|uniref:DUF2232 domain-containing protein n=1 Tax=Methylocella tundrae TaxID=227605 RepID=A0A8B6M4J9_METTU|nr:hypothetical protein [Methylocella tundrae]VTZ27439.1 conserved membrane hypothetical protein [Methylocella tundrae]VTZ49716.1 conserved membrane hypothetical protein [Methylocella tundrae]